MSAVTESEAESKLDGPSHLAVVQYHVLAKNQRSATRHSHQAIGVTGQSSGPPDLGVPLGHSIDGEGCQGHGVMLVARHAGPGGLRLVQDEQHWLIVLVQEDHVLDLGSSGHEEGQQIRV